MLVHGDSRKIWGEYSFRVSKVVNAPKKYVYEWCTDYRDDDGKFSTSKPRFRVIRPHPKRVVRVRTHPSEGSGEHVAVDLIRLSPPNAWHLDEIDDTDLESVDYRLTSLGPRRTRVTLVVTERRLVSDFPDKVETEAGSNRFWDGIVAALEESYRSGRPAKG